MLVQRGSMIIQGVIGQFSTFSPSWGQGAVLFLWDLSGQK